MEDLRRSPDFLDRSPTRTGGSASTPSARRARALGGVPSLAGNSASCQPIFETLVYKRRVGESLLSICPAASSVPVAGAIRCRIDGGRRAASGLAIVLLNLRDEFGARAWDGAGRPRSTRCGGNATGTARVFGLFGLGSSRDPVGAVRAY